MQDPNKFKLEDNENEITSNDNDQILYEAGDGIDDFETDDADYEMNDDYGRSTEKYGGYNGFSDDVIDDAFEGDPEATWNVD